MKRILLLLGLMTVLAPGIARAQCASPFAHCSSIAWTASGTSGVAGYNVYRGATSGGESSTPLNSSPVVGTSYEDDTVVAGATYYYTVRTVASDGTTLSSVSGEATDTIPGNLSAPTISPASGSERTPLTVTITCPVGATCPYTTDGSPPTATNGTITHGTAYTGPFSINPANPPVVVKSMATESGVANSAVTTASYSLQTVTAPTVGPASGQFTSPQNITIGCPSGASCFYTTDGSVASCSSTAYTAPFSLSIPNTVEAIACDAGYGPSTVTVQQYTLVGATGVTSGTSVFGFGVGP